MRENYDAAKLPVILEPTGLLIECLIQRDGPTWLTLDRFQYVFEKNEHGHAVAEVNSRSHRDYLLSLPDFRIYHPTRQAEATDQKVSGEVFLASEKDAPMANCPDFTTKAKSTVRKFTTVAERDALILEMRAVGLSERRIAEALGLGKSSVHDIVARLRAKEIQRN
jgi:hypothetical protein